MQFIYYMGFMSLLGYVCNIEIVCIFYIQGLLQSLYRIHQINSSEIARFKLFFFSYLFSIFFLSFLALKFIDLIKILIYSTRKFGEFQQKHRQVWQDKCCNLDKLVGLMVNPNLIRIKRRLTQVHSNLIFILRYVTQV